MYELQLSHLWTKRCQQGQSWKGGEKADAIQGGSCVWVGTGAKVAPQQVAKCIQSLNYCQVLKKVEDKQSKASKVKEEKLEVAGGKCWRGKWLSVLQVTGELKLGNQIVSPLFLIQNFSETWILPFAVLSAMVAYAIVAIVFYNTDGWFQIWLT